MRINTLAKLAPAAFAFAAAIAAPAQAEDWNAHLDACAAAAEAQGIVTAGEYETKFVSASGGPMKRISLEFQPNAGEPIKAECKVKRGTVKELTIKV